MTMGRDFLVRPSRYSRAMMATITIKMPVFVYVSLQLRGRRLSMGGYLVESACSGSAQRRPAEMDFDGATSSRMRPVMSSAMTEPEQYRHLSRVVRARSVWRRICAGRLRECDPLDPNDTMECLDDCTYPFCGDGW